jgi:hypothetical protein
MCTRKYSARNMTLSRANPPDPRPVHSAVGGREATGAEIEIGFGYVRSFGLSKESRQGRRAAETEIDCNFVRGSW